MTTATSAPRFSQEAKQPSTLLTDDFPLAKKLTAEAFGVLFVVATIIGTGIMSTKLAGNTDALALFVNSLACAGILVVVCTIFAPISGGHLNPAYTLLVVLQGAMRPRTGLFYVAAQIAGGCAGAILANLMFGLEAIQVSTTYRGGTSLLLAEFVAAFGLVGTVLATAKFAPTAAPTMVGIYIGCAYWFTASSSFANPAGTIGRALSNTWGGIAPEAVPLYIVAQVLGSLSAWLLFRWLTAPEAGWSSSSG